MPNGRRPAFAATCNTRCIFDLYCEQHQYWELSGLPVCARRFVVLRYLLLVPALRAETNGTHHITLSSFYFVLPCSDVYVLNDQKSSSLSTKMIVVVLRCWTMLCMSTYHFSKSKWTSTGQRPFDNVIPNNFPIDQIFGCRVNAITFARFNNAIKSFTWPVQSNHMSCLRTTTYHFTS